MSTIATCPGDEQLREFLADFENQALKAGPDEGARSGLDAASWEALVRSRRLRVLDWLSQSGMSLLNVLEGVEPAFLRFARRHGLEDKHAVARGFWEAEGVALLKGLSHGERALKWLFEVAAFELLLIEARRDRPRPRPPIRGESSVRLAPGVRVAQADPAALELHSRIPMHSLPLARRDEALRELVAALPARDPAPVDLLVVASIEGEEGFVAELEPSVSAVLRGIEEAPKARLSVREALGPETWAELLACEALHAETAPAAGEVS